MDIVKVEPYVKGALAVALHRALIDRRKWIFITKSMYIKKIVIFGKEL